MKPRLFKLLLRKIYAIGYAVLLSILTCSASAHESKLPLHIEAEQIDGSSQRVVNAYSNVVVDQGKLRAQAQWMRYASSTNWLWAGDIIRLDKDRDIVIGKRLLFNTKTYQGKIDEPIYFLHDQLGRGNALKLRFEGKDKYHLKQGRFTTCDPGDDSWYLRGADIDLDFARDHGIARQAFFEFKGVPLFYTPWVDFPLRSKRQSGFLAPMIGENSDSGAYVSLPYYWNIAPNYDATFTPKLYTKRGLMWGAEFRYLNSTYQGTVNADILPHDKISGQTRYAWKILHAQQFDTKLHLNANLQGVSDNNYFTHFANSSQAISSTLPRDILLSYQSDSWWKATLRTLHHQVLQSKISPIPEPYSRMPQFTFNATPPIKKPFALEVAGELNYFSHPTQTTGARLIVYPRLSTSLESSYGFIRSKIGVHSTVYQLDTNKHKIASPHITRVLPILSVDTGLFFERDCQFLSTNMTQTLEPRAYYVYVPYRDQSSLPNFDSARLDFNFPQIFSDNQFSGGDRINNANQLTTALSSSLYELESGLERLRFSIGQRFYFVEQRVTLPINPSPSPLFNKQTRSDMLINASSQIWHSTVLSVTSQYNTQHRQMRKSSLEFLWNPNPHKTLNLRYHLDYSHSAAIRQIDVIAQWPINHAWYAVGRYNYSIKDKKTLASILGLQYNAGCWGLHVVVQRYVTPPAGQTNTSFYLMLNLRGLGGIGNQALSVLKENIPGYSKNY